MNSSGNIKDARGGRCAPAATGLDRNHCVKPVREVLRCERFRRAPRALGPNKDRNATTRIGHKMETEDHFNLRIGEFEFGYWRPTECKDMKKHIRAYQKLT